MQKSSKYPQVYLDINELLTEFDEALDDEIKAVKSQGGNRSIELKDGRLIKEMAGGKVFQFDVERRRYPLLFKNRCNLCA